MLGHPEFTAGDYIAILKRRLWVIVIPLLIGPVAGYLVSRAVTPSYVSESLILVEQPKVPESIVRSVVATDLTQRLATMGDQILSRARLQPLIERYGLYRDAVRRGVPMADLMEEMRASIAITPVLFPMRTAPRSTVGRIFGTSRRRSAPSPSSSGNRRGSDQLTAFSIAFTAEDPRTAQQVCRELTSMFIEENYRLREQSAQGTTDFLSNQLAEAKRKLDEQDAKLAEFKRRNFGSLPDEQQTNLHMLTTLNTQLAAQSDLLVRAQQDKVFAEALLAQQVAAWQLARSGESPTSEEQLAKLRERLAVLEGRYTSDHPDVAKTRNDIAQLEKQPAERNDPAKGNGAGGVPEKALEPTQIQQLRTQVHQAEEVMRSRTHEQEQIRAQIKLYQQRLQVTPLVEQQFKDLTRDYQIALKFYEDLLAHKNESQMATDLERRQQAEQFRVLDAANLPEEPSFPDPVLFAMGGVGGGIVLGVGLAIILEMRDKSLRTERDIKFYLGLPTLVVVPSVKGLGQARKSFWRKSGKEPQTSVRRSA